MNRIEHRLDISLPPQMSFQRLRSDNEEHLDKSMCTQQWFQTRANSDYQSSFIY